jgi:hypothetical protein
MSEMLHTLPWRPRFVFGIGGDITNWRLRLPVRPWVPSTSTAGGTRTAAGGVPAGYVVRRDYNLELTLRLFERELDELDELIAWAQPGESFTWYPDRAVPGQSFEVYLESPRAGEVWSPIRTADYPKVFEMRLTLRLTTGGPWALDYFPTCP